jgi:hypothetical protein
MDGSGKNFPLKTNQDQSVLGLKFKIKNSTVIEVPLTFGSAKTAGDVNGKDVVVSTKDAVLNTNGVPTPITQPVQLPSQIQLSSNYPNPFNPSTVITVAIPSGGESVSLIVYDSLGREVETIFRGRLVEGNHSFVFSSNTLPSGVYIYKLVGDTNIITLPKSSNKYTISNAIEGVYELTLRAKSAVGPISNPYRISVAVSLTSRKANNIVATLPTGGYFNRGVDIGSSITAPNTYRFTAESGLSVTVSPTEPNITRGNYWSDGTVTRLWDGTGWKGVEGTYTLVAPSSAVEGSTLEITLNTIGIANGTNIPYTITGVSSADISGASLTGNFTVNSNTSTLTLTVASDADTGETLQLTLNNQMDYVTVIIQEAT